MEGVDGTYTRCQFMAHETQCQQFYSRIVPFEGYDIYLNNVKYCCLQFDRQQSMTLDLFINAIKSKYLRVYDGQIIQVAKLVLLHFQNLQNRNITHGNLSNENIMISLAQGSQRFVTYARPVKINKINFTNYELNPQKQKNDENNMQGIIVNLLKLVALEELKAYINKFEKQNTTSILKKISKALKLSDDCKIVSDIEESYASSRYFKGDSYSDDLRGLPTYLQSFRKEIYEKINNDTQEFKKNIEEINKQQEKDKNQIAVIQDFEIIEAPTNQINKYHEEFNLFLMDQFMQNLHEFAIIKTMKDIGEHLENASFVSRISFKTSQDAIQLQFKIQEQTFVNIFQQCQNLRKDFMIIFMAINEKKQQQFKVNIQLSLEQSYLSLIDELYYFIISQDKLKSDNILLDTGSNEFKQQWGTKMRNIIEDIYEEYFSLEVLKLIESLI